MSISVVLRWFYFLRFGCYFFWGKKCAPAWIYAFCKSAEQETPTGGCTHPILSSSPAVFLHVSAEQTSNLKTIQRSISQDLYKVQYVMIYPKFNMSRSIQNSICQDLSKVQYVRIYPKFNMPRSIQFRFAPCLPPLHLIFPLQQSAAPPHLSSSQTNAPAVTIIVIQ